MASEHLPIFDVESPNYAWQNFSQSAQHLNISKPGASPYYQILKHVFEESFCAPISSQLTSGARVLYVTSDQLAWVKDVSSKYPNSDFECLSTLNYASRPEELSDKIKFNLWNTQERSLHPDSVFDFIYVETMIIRLRTEEWPRILLELFRIVKPGGFIELQESDLYGGNMGPTSEIFSSALIYSLRARGINTKIGRELGDHLKNTGFTNITKFHISVPCGWGSPVGLAYGQYAKAMTKRMVPFIMKSLAWTEDRVLEENAKIEKEQAEFKSYINVHKAYAQKP